MKFNLAYILIAFYCNCFGQGQQFQNNNWYFGNGATMSFQNNGAPILGSPTTSLFTDEGSSSISDINGTLLFYSDGGTVWDANDAVMANGANMQGFGYGGSSVQSCIIIKKPGSANLYYIFCAAESGAPSTPFSYSIVDMSIGTGSVTSKANVIFNGTSEKIAATYHCNGTDIWIATHDLNTNNYRTVLLSSTGVSAPVITSIGPIITGNVLGQSTDGLGSMKFTSDGLHLAMSNITSPDVLDLLTFNKSTGVFSNRLDIYDPADADGLYGLEFSPSNQVLYVANYISSELLQYDISSGVAATILVSRTSVGQPFDRGINQLQLAIDGKIYAAQRRADLPIGVVNFPNVLGVACNWDNAGFDPSLGSGLPSAYGLPSQLIIITTKFNYQNTPEEIILCKTNSVTPNFYSPYPVNNGVFSCPSAGLVFNSTTGVVNAAASAVGAYTLTFTAPLSGCVSPFFSTYKISIINCNDVCMVQNHTFENAPGFNYTNWQNTWTGAGFPGDSTETNPQSAYGGVGINSVAEIDAEAWLQQTVGGFVIGNSYSLSFLASRRTDLANPSPATTIINVKIDGPVTPALTATTTRTNTTFALTLESFNFVATKTTHVLLLKPTVTTTVTSGMIIDDIDICPLLLLPIELIEFNGISVDDHSKLYWQTTTEINNDYFILEKSADGIVWRDIAKIDGAGKSAQINNYSFNDYELLPEIMYYRLKQVDFDGKKTYSQIVTIQYSFDGGVLNVFPNPSNGIYNIKTNELVISYDVVDNLGRIIFTGTSPQVDINYFANGIYYVKIKLKNEVIIKKIIKSN
jgi:hypothetical protein